jgi:hypothetical protein
MSVSAIGSIGALASPAQATTISNLATTHRKHGAQTDFATPASNALGNNATKTGGLSKDFLSVLSNMKVG